MEKRNNSSDYLKFYQDKGIIPTTQDTSDWQAHIHTRRMLYSHLGLPPSAFAGSEILEIGPGTGQNALVLHTWGPKSLTLVDANPASLKETRTRFKKAGIPSKCILCKAEDYFPKKKFDIVLCEGMIPSLPNPNKVFVDILRNTKQGGITVITCMDPIALIPEMLRRWVGRKLIIESEPLEVQAKKLVKLFTKDFHSLKGMTRFHEDWATDNIIRPWGNKFFPIPEALNLLNGDWVIQGSSPHFMQDWRWHKALAKEKKPSLKYANLSYVRFSPNLINTNMMGIDFGEKHKISQLCQKTCDLILNQEPRSAKGSDVANLVHRIANFYQAHPETREALLEFAEFAISPQGNYSKLRRFKRLWGRGQQYLSFQKI